MADPVTVAGQENAEEAINRVLEAEQRAREHIARCEAQAGEELDAVREQARRIGARTDARIGKLRTRCEQQVAEQVARFKASAEAVRNQPLTEDTRTQRQADAVRSLAARLTGGER
jgi:type I site-specific restriction endonuclease